MSCKACGLEHSPLVNCGVARRLAETAARNAAVTVTPDSVTVTAKPVTVTPKPIKPLVTVTAKADKPVTVTNRMTELRRRKAAQGLIALTIWAHPDNHAKIKAYADGIK